MQNIALSRAYSLSDGVEEAAEFQGWEDEGQADDWDNQKLTKTYTSGQNSKPLCSRQE